MKKFLLSLTLSVIAAFPVIADTSTLTLSQEDVTTNLKNLKTATVSGGNVSTDEIKAGNITWKFTMTSNLSASKPIYIAWDTNNTPSKGFQFGSSNSPVTNLTISSTGFSKRLISSVIMELSCASKATVNATVKVGDTVYKCGSNDAYTLTTNSEIATFECPDDEAVKGEVTISLDQTTSKAIYIKSIEVVYEDDAELPLPNIFYSRSEYYICKDDIADFETPVLSNNNEVSPIQYTLSCNEDVATVNENGVVTIVAAEVGEIVLTANFAGNEQFSEETASCTIYITEEKYFTVAFDFENEDYGMTRFSGDVSQRNPDVCNFGNHWLKCSANSGTVLWLTSAGNKSLRVFPNGEIFIESPEGSEIVNVYIYHFNADGDPEEVTMDAEHEHVVEMAGNYAILTGQEDWEAEHHKVSKIEVIYRAAPSVITSVEDAFKASTKEDFTINGNKVGTDNIIVIDESGSMDVVISHNYPHATIYHKWEPKQSAASVRGRYVASKEGFTEHNAPLNLTSAGTLSYYAELNGHETPIQTVAITTSDDPTSIVEVSAVKDGEAVYDLMGRKVVAPVRGLYIQNGAKKFVR